MADTVLTSESEKRLYETNLFISAENDSFWARFSGPAGGTTEIVQILDEPEKAEVRVAIMGFVHTSNLLL